MPSFSLAIGHVLRQARSDTAVRPTVGDAVAEQRRDRGRGTGARARGSTITVVTVLSPNGTASTWYTPGYPFTSLAAGRPDRTAAFTTTSRMSSCSVWPNTSSDASGVPSSLQVAAVSGYRATRSLAATRSSRSARESRRRLRHELRRETIQQLCGFDVGAPGQARSLERRQLHGAASSRAPHVSSGRAECRHRTHLQQHAHASAATTPYTRSPRSRARV